MKNYSHKFRRAKLDDLEQVCDLLLSLNEKIGAAYGIPIDPKSFVATAHDVITNGICLVGHGAVAGAKLTPWPYNRKAIIGVILFWNFTTPKGARIFDAMAQELKAAGATHISASSHFPSNRAGDMYAKEGMRPVETQWLLEIEKSS